MKVLFTGAKGALGKKYMELFPETVPFHIRYGDNEGLIALSNELKKTDVLIHASANLNPHSVDDAILDNAILPLDILDMAWKVNPNTHIILIGSMSTLGENGSPKNIRDMSFYAASKYIMEELALKVAKNPITIVRFSTLFYADYTRDGLSKIVYNAWKYKSVSTSDCRRDFLPLWAACKWINKLCNNKTWYNKSINLASGRNVNMVDIANYLVEKYKVEANNSIAPEYSDICYNFSPEDPQSLERITFDIYKLIDEYYESLGRV